ncbi:MAG: HAMP domain-containing histidine kinase [Nitratireductor sp.]|nr:HAMP domain-containing histidine kinase [Nitratireductor sp.]
MPNTKPSKTGRDASVASLAQRLRQAEEACALAGTPELVQPWSIHDDRGRLLAMSERAARLLGHDPARDCGHFLDLVQVLDRVPLGQFLATVNLPAARDSGPMHFRPLRSGMQGAAGWVEISAGSEASPAEGCHIFSMRDVTRERETGEAAARLREEAEKANIAKSRFLANMSHELRTPLNAILGFSDLLRGPLADKFDAARKAEYVGLIHDSASHLLDVLNGILDMSKIDHGLYEIFPERFDLARCLTTTAAIMRGQAEIRSIGIECAGFEDAPEIVADERAVRQILINLLSNAIKFSPERSIIEVSVRRLARFVKLSVQDCGVGISAENIGQLGTPFFQADSKHDRKFEGTGLGLSVVKGLVELHGGKVEFSSRRGQGTLATVTLPIHGIAQRKVAAPSQISRIERVPEKKPDETGGNEGEARTNLRILRNIA